ncbi:hypothetical protein MF1_06130 [Bartonella quintana]|uniref:hypothetical protein n=1 Tax=Bartonella quintana TaxID=803 RepID=UPI00027FCA82|nr:hypothetical protein RM11_0624 [Bartonella quintana RM-11]BBL53355.1 hypothetical protein MF1_06130 [Bartonella quintana]
MAGMVQFNKALAVVMVLAACTGIADCLQTLLSGSVYDLVDKKKSDDNRCSFGHFLNGFSKIYSKTEQTG